MRKFILNEAEEENELNVAPSNTQNEDDAFEVDEFSDDEEESELAKFKKEKAAKDAEKASQDNTLTSNDETDKEQTSTNDAIDTLEMYVPIDNPQAMRDLKSLKFAGIITKMTQVGEYWKLLNGDTIVGGPILNKNVSYPVTTYQVTFTGGSWKYPGGKVEDLDINQIRNELINKNSTWFTTLYNNTSTGFRRSSIKYTEICELLIALRNSGEKLTSFADCGNIHSKYNDCFVLKAWYHMALVSSKALSIASVDENEVEAMVKNFKETTKVDGDDYTARTSSTYNNYGLINMLETMIGINSAKVEVVQSLPKETAQDSESSVVGTDIVKMKVIPILDREKYKRLSKTLAGQLFLTYEPYKTAAYPEVLRSLPEYESLIKPSLYTFKANGKRYVFSYSPLANDVEHTGVTNNGGQTLEFTGTLRENEIKLPVWTGKWVIDEKTHESTKEYEEEPHQVVTNVVLSETVADDSYNATCLALMQYFGTQPALDYYKFANKNNNIIPTDDLKVSYFLKLSQSKYKDVGVTNARDLFYNCLFKARVHPDEYLAQYKKGSELE